ncbi:isoaspartyl peptidase/L-asparaginase family protein [Tellurirhabdus rosea]|uniref:isoaspartyl peptidase/L-asparaginase family protein n=1 Tax=Tellurirhabdus rosea TaxID=2674997 RepID=UPI002255EE93|nr:isoaspartyl peptidase/L-asparaginase [Tellurirhabdus rosea]
MFVIAIHGGAEPLTPADLSEAEQKQYLQGLDEALTAGYDVLESGGTALDAVTAAVMAMENNVLFNAGRGAAFTAAGTHELEAALMRGDTLEAGCAAGVVNLRNPVLLARAVMEKTEHVLMVGSGAEEFAREQGLEFDSDDYFFSEKKAEELQEKQEAVTRDTIGAVALDRHGNLAAATSTGGLTGQLPGRVGDTAIIGVGTYANNDTCAVSCTGDGEFFIRTVAAYDVSCQIGYQQRSLKEACRSVLDKIAALGGEGGIIAVTPAGEVALEFNSGSMFRGWRSENGKGDIRIFRTE